MTWTDFELAYLPAHRQIELFRTRRLSPVDVLKAQIGRIEALNPQVNALTYQHFETALDAANESERRYGRRDFRALEGVTVAVKDEYDRVGWHVTAGSVLLKDEVSPDTHPVIEKLIAAGALLHVQTTAPEFYLVAVTWSDLWGVTRNPWNLDCTPGGSSGGSAVALAGGMATLAIGSDMGGSIRIPCALTGLYGSKPAYGRIASPDPSALVPHASPGPLARDITDLILLQNVIGGPAPRCPAVLPKLELPLQFDDSRRLRIALSIDQGWATIESDVRANTIAAARRLEAAGAIVDEVELRLETSDAELGRTIEKALFSTTLGADLVEHVPEAGRMTTYGRRFVELAGRLGPQDAKKAARESLRLYGLLERQVFDRGYDALITPTVATARLAAEFDPTRDRVIIDGKEVDPYAGWFLASIFSLLNWMPVINVPTGRAANNVPTGMQIVARPYDDITAALVAARYSGAAEPVRFDEIEL